MRTILIASGQQTAIQYLDSIVCEQFSKQAELAVVRKIVSSSWAQLQEFQEILFHRNGADVEIKGANKSIAIEVKASNRKADYFIRNGVKAELWGNALKHKDIDLKTGLIKADFLVFVAADVPNVAGGLDYWLFSRDDLSTLHPRAVNFIPSHIPTLMADVVKLSHLNDAYNAFHKGAMVIVLPEYKNGAWGEYPSGPNHDYVDNWCPLITEEYKELENIVKAKLSAGVKEDFSQIFSYMNTISSNPNFHPKLCEFYLASQSNSKCADCKKNVSAVSSI